MDKTNVMRVLDSKSIKYEIIDWSNKTLEEIEKEWFKEKIEDTIIYKTLVTIGKSKEHYVFVIPISEELDLKKAASSVGEKNIEMIHQKELLPLTGYIHGGCSPIGMKKQFVTVFDETYQLVDYVVFSAGKVGYSVKIKTSDLPLVLSIKSSNLTKLY